MPVATLPCGVATGTILGTSTIVKAREGPTFVNLSIYAVVLVVLCLASPSLRHHNVVR